MAQKPWVVSDELWDRCRAAAAQSGGGSGIRGGSRCRTGRPVRDLVRPAHRHPVGTPPSGAGVRLGGDCWRRLEDWTRPACGSGCTSAPGRAATPPRVDWSGRWSTPRTSGRKRGRQRAQPGRPGRPGPNTTSSPTAGIPLAVSLTGGNRNDVTQLMPLLDASRRCGASVGRPRRRPDTLFADRGYDHDATATSFAPAASGPRSPGAEPPTAPGWPPALGVERSLSWLHGFRRLRSAGNDGPTSTRPSSTSPAA